MENQALDIKDIDIICKLATKIVITNLWIEEFELIKKQQYRYNTFNQKENKIRKIDILSGYINGWSIPFTVQLTKGEYLTNQLGYKPILQVLLGENNTLILFHKTKQVFKKIIALAIVEATTVPNYKWIATKFNYEHLAKLLNKSGKIDAKTASNYIGLILTDETLSLKDRVLCTKQNLGDKIVITTYLNSEFIDENNNVKYGYEWLDQVRKKITSKMLQPNAKEVVSKIQNAKYQQDVSLDDKRTRDMVSTMTRTFRKVVRSHNLELSDNQTNVLAVNILEYLIMALNMTRAQLVDTKHKLLISDELRITEPDNYDKRVIEFNKLVDKVRKYHKDKSTNSLKTQPAIIEPTQQLSRRAKKAIAKQQANTTTINNGTNLVSLIKK